MENMAMFVKERYQHFINFDESDIQKIAEEYKILSTKEVRTIETAWV